MSHVVQVWEHPVSWIYPTELATTVAMLDALRLRRPGPNPLFTEFARRLTARHPCITSPDSDDLDESELAWGDGPLDGRADAAVYAIGLNRARLDEVLPFVRETARELGLSVFDEQAGHAWLANGAEQAVGRERIWQRFPPAHIEIGRTLPDKDALLDRVLEGGGSALAALGFTPHQRDARDDAQRLYTSAVLRRASPIGWQEMELRAIDKRPDCVRLTMRIEAWVTSISDWRLQVHHGGRVPPDARPLSNIGLRSDAWMSDTARAWETADGGSIVLRSPDDVERAVAMLDHQWRTRLAPLLAAFDSLGALAEVLAPEPIEWSPFFTRHVFAADALVAAYLARSPRLPALVQQVRQHARPMDPKGSGMRAFVARHDEAMLKHLLACIEQMERVPPPR